jgi:hypothetical protein
MKVRTTYGKHQNLTIYHREEKKQKKSKKKKKNSFPKFAEKKRLISFTSSE